MAKKIELGWIDDVWAKRRMNLLGIKWEKRMIRLSEIDFEESRINSARLRTPIVRTAVEDYKSAMLAGDAFPMPVVYRTAKGYVISWGNQRTTAVQELARDRYLSDDDPEVRVYVAMTSEKILLDTLTRTGNNENGRPVEREERMEQAVYSVNTLGTTVKDASAQYNVGEGAIKDRLRADKERSVCATLGIDLSGSPNAVLVELSRVKDRNLKEKIGRLTYQHSPSSDRVRQVAQAVTKADSRESQIQAVKRFEQELADESRRALNGRKSQQNGLAVKRSLRRPRRDRFISMLTTLANYLDSGMSGEPFVSLQSLQADGVEDEKTIKGLWFRIDGKMQTILKKK